MPLSTPGVEIRDCHLRGSLTSWSPGDPRSPVDEGACLIDRCAVDERLDLKVATRAALSALAATWEATGHDPFGTLAAHARESPEAAVAQHLLATCAYTDPDACAFAPAPSEAEVRRHFEDGEARSGR